MSHSFSHGERKIEDAATWLASVAASQAEAGSADVAPETMARALSLAEGIADEDYRSRALAAIAIAQARIGDHAGAHRSVDAIVVETSRRAAQKGIAGIQARAGQWQEAVRTVESTRTARAGLLVELAGTFAEAGIRDGLKVILQSRAHDVNTAYALCALLAKVYPEQLPALADAVVRAESRGRPAAWSTQEHT